MQVRDLMNPSVVSITPSESASLAARLLSRHNVGSLPVCGEDGGLRGIVTDRDIILRCVAAEEDPLKTQVKDIMTRNCAVVSPDDDAREATRIIKNSSRLEAVILKNFSRSNKGSCLSFASLSTLWLNPSQDNSRFQ